MKIDRRNLLLASSAALLSPRTLWGAVTKSENTSQAPSRVRTGSQLGKQVKVYTTADKTDHRLTLTDTLNFRHVGQPKETQICVFVDPGRQFQAFLGIGGALTDAAAEVFDQLPNRRQNEILHAYYD